MRGVELLKQPTYVMALNTTEEEAEAAEVVADAAVDVWRNNEMERATAEAVRSVETMMKLGAVVKQGMFSAGSFRQQNWVVFVCRVC